MKNEKKYEIEQELRDEHNRIELGGFKEPKTLPSIRPHRLKDSFHKEVSDD